MIKPCDILTPMTGQQPSQPQQAPQAKQSQWAQKNIGASWQLRTFHWIIKHRGREHATWLSAVVAFWYVLFYPGIRRRTRYYLSKRFPDRTRWHQRFWDSYRLVRTYSKSLVDMGAHAVHGIAATHITSPDHDAFMALQHSDQGVVMLQAHAGCWQIGMSTLRHFEDRKISLVLIPEPSTVAQFDGMPIELIDPRTGMQSILAMTSTLLENNILVMMGDRTFDSSNNAVKVKFLGCDAYFPAAPYRLASTTGSRVAFATSAMTPQGGYELRLQKVIDIPAGLGKKAVNYTPYAQMFADCLEAFVMENPWQFYNFYNLWQEDGKGSDQI